MRQQQSWCRVIHRGELNSSGRAFKTSVQADERLPPPRKRGYPTQTKTFTKLADAERWATIIESEMERGVFVSRNEAEATFVKDMLQRFKDEVLPSKRSEQSDRSRIKTLTDAFGDYRMASLTSTQIAQFRDQRLKSVGPQSVIHEINFAESCLKDGSDGLGNRFTRRIADRASSQTR